MAKSKLKKAKSGKSKVATNSKKKTAKSKIKPKGEAAKITKHMNINEIISRYPNTLEVFFKYGFHCIGCQAAAFESLEEGARAHGMSDETIENFVKDLNESAKQESKFKQ